MITDMMLINSDTNMQNATAYQTSGRTTQSSTNSPNNNLEKIRQIIVVERETPMGSQCKQGWNNTSGRCVHTIRQHLNYVEATATCNRMGSSLIFGQGIMKINPKFKPSNFWMDYLGFDRWFWVAEKDEWRHKIIQRRRWKNGQKIKIPFIEDTDACVQCGEINHCLASNLKEVAFLLYLTASSSEV